MAKFVFTGDPLQGTNRKVRREGADDSRGVTAFGIDFPRGEEVEVAETHPAINKLRKNSHFNEVVGSQAKAAPKAKAVASGD